MTPIRETDGIYVRYRNSLGGLFRPRHLRKMGGGFGRQELTGHRAPIYAAARALLARGASPKAALRMRHRGSATVSMTGVIGELAKLTVVEDDAGLRIVKCRDRQLIAAE